MFRFALAATTCADRRPSKRLGGSPSKLWCRCMIDRARAVPLINKSETRVMPEKKKPQQRHGFRTNEYIVYPAQWYTRKDRKKN